MNFPQEQLTSTSKFLSLILRHRPELIGLQLDSAGWLNIDALIENANGHGKQLSLELIHEVVATCAKQRFALNKDGLKIRANQGHSIPSVQLNYQAAQPPAQLYHGTVAVFLKSIRQQGLLKRTRNHVHLSSDIATAVQVGARRGQPVVLTVDSGAMQAAGHCFYRSANAVWLTETVPAHFIRFPDQI